MELQTFKSTLLNMCYQYHRARHSLNGLFGPKHETVKRTRGNADIMLSRPENGAGIVPLTKSDYTAKNESHSE